MIHDGMPRTPNAQRLIAQIAAHPEGGYAVTTALVQYANHMARSFGHNELRCITLERCLYGRAHDLWCALFDPSPQRD